MSKLTLGIIVENTQFDLSRPISEGFLGPKAANMLVRLYGLAGKPKMKIEDYAKEQGVIRERICFLYRKHVMLLKRKYPSLIIDRREY